jgi:hypothetical protein
MNRHLDWKELDLYARGLAEGAIEVHLAECGECAAKLAKLRDEEDAVKAALEPGDASEDEVDQAVARALATPKAKPPRGLAFVPLAAAAALVIALVGVMSYRPPADPLGDALAHNDWSALERFGVKAARHAPAPLAAKLREMTPRVLVVEGAPRTDYKKLEPALLKDASLAAYTMLLSSREPDAYRRSEGLTKEVSIFPLADADLRDFDVIVLGQVKAARLASSPDVFAAAMRSFVTRLGGTLVCVAGEQSSPDDAHHAIADLMPIDFARATEVRDTAALEATAAARWTDLPGEGVRWHLSAPLREGSTAWLVTARGAPVISVREAGRGRVIFVASDDFGYAWHTKPAGFFPFYRKMIVE